MSDAISLQEKIKLVDENLIMAVGKYKPTKLGKAELYDLGGNVSEYYMDNGLYKIFGYSAYDLADENNQKSNQNSKFVGVRLIME